jgi:hypothetical protein
MIFILKKAHLIRCQKFPSTLSKRSWLIIPICLRMAPFSSSNVRGFALYTRDLMQYHRKNRKLKGRAIEEVREHNHIVK